MNTLKRIAQKNVSIDLSFLPFITVVGLLTVAFVVFWSNYNNALMNAIALN